MKRKIITIAATALAIGTLSVAPLVAEAATVPVSAIVLGTAQVVAAPASLVSWTKSGQTAGFTVTVTTTNPGGYTFAFNDGSQLGNANFTLSGALPGNTLGASGICVGNSKQGSRWRA